MENLNSIGKPSTFACPDCDGVLWEIADTRPARYRCHTGHAFSLRTLADTQGTATEDALWTAMAERHEAEAEEAARHARHVQDMLTPP